MGTVDGKFGTGTRAGVIAFQKIQGLHLSGEADPRFVIDHQDPRTVATLAIDGMGPKPAGRIDLKLQGGSISVTPDTLKWGSC